MTHATAKWFWAGMMVLVVFGMFTVVLHEKTPESWLLAAQRAGIMVGVIVLLVVSLFKFSEAVADD